VYGKSQRLSKTGDIGGFEDQFARIITKLPPHPTGKRYEQEVYTCYWIPSNF